MYRLLERTAAGLPAIARSFQALVLEEGRRLIQAKCQDIAAASVADGKSADHVKRGLPLVREMMRLHTKYKKIVESCFAKNNVFTKSLDQAFKVFLNNSVGGFGMAELLAYYADSHIRSASRSRDEEMEAELDTIVRLFCYPVATNARYTARKFVQHWLKFSHLGLLRKTVLRDSTCEWV